MNDTPSFHTRSTDQKRRQPPAFNAPGLVLWLISVNIAIYVFSRLAPTSLVEPVSVYLVFNPADLRFFSDNPDIILIRWIGYGFSHQSLLHLFVNCAFILAFGTPLARQIPISSFLFLYSLCIIAGAVAVTITHPQESLYLIGASGGASGLVGALSRMVFVRRGAEMIPPPFNNSAFGKIFIFVFIGTNLIFGFLPGPGGISISGESHLGGFVAGFILSLFLPWKAGGRRDIPAND